MIGCLHLVFFFTFFFLHQGVSCPSHQPLSFCLKNNLPTKERKHDFCCLQSSAFMFFVFAVFSAFPSFMKKGKIISVG